MSLRRQVLADSPLAYWPLDDLTGTQAADVSGHGHHGTYAGGVTLGQQVAGFTCPAFNGTNGCATVPDPSSIFQGHPFSAEIWARTLVNGWKSAMAKCHQIAAATKWDLRVRNDHKPIAYLDRTTGAGPNVAGPNNIDDGIFHHLLFTWDGTTTTFYVDGVSVGTATGTSTQIEVAGTLALSIGAYDGSTGGEYWDGHLAHAACYPTVLAPDRIKAHFQAGRRRAVVV